MNLLMLSGDNSVARGKSGAFDAMLRHFSRYWARIDILTPTAPDAQPRILHENVHVHPAPRHRALQPLFIRQKGGELLRERDYALMTSQDFGFFYNGIGAWWLLREHNIPTVSEVHHIEGVPIATTRREKLWRQAASWYFPRMNRRATAFRVVNNTVAEQLQTYGILPEKILLLSSLYLDLEALHPLPDVEKVYDVLFVGRLAANKGIMTLLQAVLQAGNVTLGIRGEGALRDEIEAYSAKHNLNVTFIPRTDDMTTLYNQARMLVCASTVEGNPRVTAEAMACGVPVISTPVGIMPQLINDGANGLLFEWDANELAQKIRLLLDDEGLRQRMGAAGRQAVQPYAAQQTIQRYAEAYHALAQT